ncbi:MAG TPA: SRPBCC family protein [Solirubrobacteraceae bacterium]
MDALNVSIVVARPIEEVFSYLLDIANHPEFTDHYLDDWHLTRTDTVGLGAGARFRVKAPLQRFSWMGLSIVEVDEPRRIVESGSGGKFNRVQTQAVYTLESSEAGRTQVALSTTTQPVTASDRMLERFGGRTWLRRQNTKALERLRSILEGGVQPGRRATIAGL